MRSATTDPRHRGPSGHFQTASHTQYVSVLNASKGEVAVLMSDAPLPHLHGGHAVIPRQHSVTHAGLYRIPRDATEVATMLEEWSADDLQLLCEKVRELADCRPDCQIRVIERDNGAYIYCEEHYYEVEIPRFAG